MCRAQFLIKLPEPHVNTSAVTPLTRTHTVKSTHDHTQRSRAKPSTTFTISYILQTQHGKVSLKLFVFMYLKKISCFSSCTCIILGEKCRKPLLPLGSFWHVLFTVKLWCKLCLLTLNFLKFEDIFEVIGRTEVRQKKNQRQNWLTVYTFSTTLNHSNIPYSVRSVV